MKLVLMQPYFFPYLGYFQLMHLCDQFIVFDTVQYIKKGWINRNRILHPNGGSAYINVPIHKPHSDTLIKDVLIKNNQLWKEIILNRLQHYYLGAPNKENVINFMKEIFLDDFDSLSELNTHILKRLCEHLEIKCTITTLSKSHISVEQANSPDEWGLHICKALDAKTYINAPGGITFFDRNKYRNEKIDIKFIKPIFTKYNQNKEHFEPGLSIIDLLMFNSVEKIQEMLNNYEEISGNEIKNLGDR